MKVTRRRTTPIATAPEERYLRFTTGKVVDPLACPRRIAAHSHWTLLEQPVPVGEPNTICACRISPSDGAA